MGGGGGGSCRRPSSDTYQVQSEEGYSGGRNETGLRSDVELLERPSRAEEAPKGLINGGFLGTGTGLPQKMAPR